MISNPRHGSPPRLMAHQPTRCSTTQESSIRVHRPEPVSDAGFRAPVRIGDTVHVQVEVVELIPDRHRARLACTCSVGEEVVLDGEALIKVPSAANSPPLFSPGG